MSSPSSHQEVANASETTRRTFVKTATAAALAVAGVHSPANALQESIRVSVVGAGSRGCELLRHLVAMESVTLVAVCDDFVPHLEHGKKTAGDSAKPFEDYRTMLDSTEIDVVVVATPLGLHHES